MNLLMIGIVITVAAIAAEKTVIPSAKEAPMGDNSLIPISRR